MVQAVSTELTLERVNQAVAAILEVLGTPETDLHTKALTAFQSGDHQTVKRLASTNLSDYYVKSLGYLGGALKLTPNTDTILAESARAAADFAKEKALKQLGDAIAQALN
jgi:F0F1-type ATP synthase epsilon subunit